MLDNHRLAFVWSGIVAATRTKAGALFTKRPKYLLSDELEFMPNCGEKEVK